MPTPTPTPTPTPISVLIVEEKNSYFLEIDVAKYSRLELLPLTPPPPPSSSSSSTSIANKNKESKQDKKKNNNNNNNNKANTIYTKHNNKNKKNKKVPQPPTPIPIPIPIPDNTYSNSDSDSDPPTPIMVRAVQWNSKLTIFVSFSSNQIRCFILDPNPSKPTLCLVEVSPGLPPLPSQTLSLATARLENGDGILALGTLAGRVHIHHGGGGGGWTTIVDGPVSSLLMVPHPSCLENNSSNSKVRLFLASFHGFVAYYDISISIVSSQLNVFEGGVILSSLISAPPHRPVLALASAMVGQHGSDKSEGVKVRQGKAR